MHRLLPGERFKQKPLAFGRVAQNMASDMPWMRRLDVTPLTGVFLNPAIPLTRVTVAFLATGANARDAVFLKTNARTVGHDVSPTYAYWASGPACLLKLKCIPTLNKHHRILHTCA